MPQIHRFIPRSVQLRVAFAATIFTLAGCSDQPPRPDLRGEQLGFPAEKPTLSAQQSFFDGKLLVEANLGRGFSGRGGPGKGRSDGPAGGPRHDGERPFGPGDGPGAMGDYNPDGYGGGSTLHESSMPPVALRLRLTNASQESVEIVFTLCKSELGDFAVRPGKITIAPGQSIEPDSMTSRLGLTSAEIVLEVGLRMAGKAEQKEMVLKSGVSTAPSAKTGP